jgi:hypothetical protein
VVAESSQDCTAAQSDSMNKGNQNGPQSKSACMQDKRVSSPDVTSVYMLVVFGS